MEPMTDQPLTDAGLRLLSGPLQGLSGNGRRVAVAGTTTIRPNVHRLTLDGAPRATVVVKRLSGRHADLERLVTRRWLPAVGLQGLGPPLLTAVGDPDGHHAWHVYEDLGPRGLDRKDPDAASLGAAMEEVAELHTAFSSSALLPEPRFAAGDMGAYFYVKSVRDAFRSVDLLRPPAVEMSSEREAVRDRMLDLLTRLRDDEPNRVRILEHGAGPETLVHGDLTRANVFVMDGTGRPRVCLIDWDHCGVAPAGFDISTQLAYYQEPERRLVLDAYTAAMAERGCRLPGDLDWPLLVSTFEAGRLANQVIWVAMGIRESSGWTWSDLAVWRDELSAAVEGAPIRRLSSGKP